MMRRASTSAALLVCLLAVALPAAGTAAEVTVTPETVPPGATVTVTARDFPPGEAVEIGIGPPYSEYNVIATGRTDDAGRLDRAVTLAADLRPGRTLVFVVATLDFRVKAVSAPVRVVPLHTPSLVGSPPPLQAAATNGRQM